MKFDVGIIGGGVIGLACAWRLAQAGARVGVFERGVVGREASWAAAGMLAAQCEAAHHPPTGDQSTLSARQAMFDLCLQSRTIYPSFAHELFEASGIDIELSLRGAQSTFNNPGDWRTPGILYVQTRENDLIFRTFSRQREAGCAVENAPDFAGHRAMWLPDEGQVDNRRLVRALRLACERSGVEIYEKSDAKIHVSALHNVDLRNSARKLHCQVGGLSFNHAFIRCGKVLLCAGAWSKRQYPLSRFLQLPVKPLAGEIIAVRAGHLLPHIVYSSDAYLVPRRDGTLLIGATMVQRGFDKSTTEAAKTQLFHAASKVVPEIASCEIVDHWAGLRPVSPDSLPILGAAQLQNFYVATGHGRNGILLTPITAQLMADCILNDQAVPSAFSMDRFLSLTEKEL